METVTSTTLSTHQLVETLRSIDASVILAPAHILRRVIRLHTGAGGFFRKTPHRKSLVIAADDLLKSVDAEELDLPSSHQFVSPVLLIQRPKPEKLNTLPASQLLLEYWRLLFHSRADAHMNRLSQQGKLTAGDAVQRIHAIGQAAFDEIRSVLTKERFLLPPADNVRVYSEFVSVYLELKHFLPHALNVYFPTIDSFERVDRVIAGDIDGDELFRVTKLPGAAMPGPAEALTNQSDSPPIGPKKTRPPEEQREAAANYERLMRRADKAASLGNHARAAITRNRASHQHFPGDERHTRNVVRPEIERLARRLCRVLEIEDGDALVQAMAALLDPTAQGWATPGARLLYDLQAVCIDHERDLFKLDLVAWVLSRGEVPIKRKLPAAKEVRLHQHLSKAVDRLHKANFPEEVRSRLLELLEPKLHVIEQSVRETMRPKILKVIQESGLNPNNPPEEIARQKLVEELLDRVIERGFISMGDLRDAISRNQLKLPDVTKEAFVAGDELLKIDKRLSRVLDGVYRRGELYRRWPQRMSSLAFGTKIGRFFTQYLAIPYLGAFLLLEMAQHIVHMFVPPPKPVAQAVAAAAAGADAVAVIETTGAASHAAAKAVEHAGGIHFTTPLSIFITGTILLWLFHADRIRAALFKAIKWSFNRFYGIVIDLPSEILRLEWVKSIANNRAARITYRYALKPAFFGALIWIICHTWGLDWGFSLTYALGFFIIMNLLFNTRFGRGIEEGAGEFIAKVWRRFGWKVLVATVLWIVDVFKWLLDAFEELRYNVDEWLRFRTGENRVAFAGKLIVGTIWFFVSYIVVFCVTLLIEPQVNPIKHFPVVTVSHKVMIGLVPMFANIVAPLFDGDMGEATAFVFSIVWLIPGIFGYLAWELKENWRLYKANRSARLRPVIVGHHGESMLGLLKPGFHSGTVPKLYGKLRKLERRRAWKPPGKAERKHKLALHHVEQSIERFVERDLIATLALSTNWSRLPLTCGHVHLGGNSASIELHCPTLAADPARLVFEEQSGWLITSIAPTGWIALLTAPQRETLLAALSGFYKYAAVDLVREQIEAIIDVKSQPYDVDERGIVVWPAADAQPILVYPLLRDPPSANGQANHARPAAESSARLEPGQSPALFRHHPILWTQWVQMWDADQQSAAQPAQLVDGPPLVRIPSP